MESETVEWWRRCEIAWSAHLQANEYAVTHLNEATGNTQRTIAPLISIGGRHYRAPDFQSVKNGVSEYWEIKYRLRTDVDALTGRREFWMEFASFKDYLQVCNLSGCKVWIALYEHGVDGGRWLVASILEIRDSGRRKNRFGQGAVEVDAWVWPADVMKPENGPEVVGKAPQPLLPNEGNQNPIPLENFNPFERQLRRRRLPKEEETHPTPESAVRDAERNNHPKFGFEFE